MIHLPIHLLIPGVSGWLRAVLSEVSRLGARFSAPFAAMGRTVSFHIGTVDGGAFGDRAKRRGRLERIGPEPFA